MKPLETISETDLSDTVAKIATPMLIKNIAKNTNLHTAGLQLLAMGSSKAPDTLAGIMKNRIKAIEKFDGQDGMYNLMSRVLDIYFKTVRALADVLQLEPEKMKAEAEKRLAELKVYSEELLEDFSASVNCLEFGENI